MPAILAIVLIGASALNGGGAALLEEATTPAGAEDAETLHGELLFPPCGVMAGDVPDDGGGAIRIEWAPPEHDADLVRAYEILRYAPGGEPVVIGEALATETSYVDGSAEDGLSYQYVVRAVTPLGSADSEPSTLVASQPQWFARGRLNVLVLAALFSAAVLWYVRRARRGIDLYIRKIPGLDAVDDAVGRATEMGRPVLYVPGIETVSEVGTLASLTILGHVAKRVAQHGTPLEVPCADPIVMATAQEIVRQSYTEVGEIDRYDPNHVAYLTYDQFGYAAGVDGMMVRERPGAVFLLGYFAAESLILAETGHSIGAIQIAGTKETSQLPFFVAACDYTLIGEEIFAASSYLGREPVMLGSLVAQDLGKLWIVYLIVFAFVVGTIGTLVRPDGSSILTRVFEALRTWFG